MQTVKFLLHSVVNDSASKKPSHSYFQSTHVLMKWKMHNALMITEAIKTFWALNEKKRF